MELASFIDGVFFPFYRRKWKASTRMTTEGRIVFHIRNPYADRKLGSFSRDELQTLLEKKAGASRMIGTNSSSIRTGQWSA